MSKKLHVILLLLFLLSTYSQSGYSQINVRLYQPPPNQLTVEHLWNFDLINNTTQTFYISLTGTAMEMDAGLIFEARSSAFELPPGFKRVSVPEISPISVSYSDPEYEDIVQRTGSVPTGNYEICITVIDEESGEQIGRDCLQQFVEHAQPPRLISPFDGATVMEPFPVFTWMHPGIDGSYELRIVEILDGQTPLEAIQSNPPWLEIVDIRNTTFQYPISAREMNNGQSYAWQVLLADAAEIGASEIRTFTFGDSVEMRTAPPRTEYSSLVDGRIYGRSYLLQKDIYENMTKSSPEMTSENILFEKDTLQESFSVAWKDTIAKLRTGDEIMLSVSSSNVLNAPVALNMHYRNAADSVWRIIGTDSDSLDGWNTTWNLENVNEGFYEIRVQAVNQNNDVAANYMAVQVGDLPRPSEIALNEQPVVLNLSISEYDIRRKWNEARRARNRASRARERARELEEQRNQRIREYRRARTQAEQLRRIDELIDNMPQAFQGRVQTLLDSLKAIRERAGGEPDQAALQAAVNDAQRRLDECRNRLANLNQKQQQLQQQRDDLKKQQDDLLKQLDKMHHDDGWIGESGFHDDGRIWWGYVGDENSTLDEWGSPGYNQVRQLQRNIKQLNEQYRNTLAQLNQLAASIAESEDDCAELEEQLKQAQEAKKNGDEYQAARTTIDEICREIRSLLQSLVEWCDNNPDHCNFNRQLDQLLTDCPEDEAEWQRFWREFENVKNRKQAQEERFEREAERAREDAQELDEEIEEAEEQAKEHERNAREAEAEAERMREQRERQIKEQERRRRQQEQEENARRERQRELLRRAENGDEDAIKKLMTEMGLTAISQTGQSAGNLVTILKGIMVLKDMPQCACKIMKALKNLLNPNNPDQSLMALASIYLDEWRNCAGLPTISSVSLGTDKVVDMVRQIPDDTKRKAIRSIDKIISVKCR